jgi:hypothetical protein
MKTNKSTAPRTSPDTDKPPPAAPARAGKQRRTIKIEMSKDMLAAIDEAIARRGTTRDDITEAAITEMLDTIDNPEWKMPKEIEQAIRDSQMRMLRITGRCHLPEIDWRTFLFDEEGTIYSVRRVTAKSVHCYPCRGSDEWCGKRVIIPLEKARQMSRAIIPHRLEVGDILVWGDKACRASSWYPQEGPYGTWGLTGDWNGGGEFSEHERHLANDKEEFRGAFLRLATIEEKVRFQKEEAEARGDRFPRAAMRKRGMRSEQPGNAEKAARALKRAERGDFPGREEWEADQSSAVARGTCGHASRRRAS